MRSRAGLLVIILLSVASYARAQDNAPDRSSFDLSALVDVLRPGGPNWQGRAEFPAAPNAVGRVIAGPHRVGAVIAEIEIAPTRTARLLEPAILSDLTHGDRTIPAGTVLFARNGAQIESHPGRPVVVTDRGPLEWCVIDAGLPLCITMTDAQSARYRETDTDRSWSGPAPVLQQGPIAFDPPLVWSISITAIDDRGISLESWIGRGDQRVRERGFGFITPGNGVNLTERYPGLLFRLRSSGEHQVVVDAQ